MINESYQLELVQLPMHPMLGRNVNHDSRSKSFRVKPRGVPRTCDHPLVSPVMLRQTIGSCTGNAPEYAILTEPFYSALPDRVNIPWGNELATDLYRENTRNDPFPGVYEPEDTGSDGLSAAKTLKRRGYISGFENAFGVEDVMSELPERACITGTVWKNSMFITNGEGIIDVDRGSADVGGHEYCLTRMDMERGLIGGPMSWGYGFGVAGWFWLELEDYEWLLEKNQGDATFFTPANLPAPVPTPPPVVPDIREDKLFADTYKFRNSKFYGGGMQAKRALKEYFKA